jgi:hypothetical protein
VLINGIGAPRRNNVEDEYSFINDLKSGRYDALLLVGSFRAELELPGCNDIACL